MSGYSQKVARLNKAADIKNLGVRLGRFCVSNNIPVSVVMEFFDVSKQTVYNWFFVTHVPSSEHQQLISTFLGRD
jgi:hypothetical protein